MVISFHLSNIFSLSLSFLPHFFFSFFLSSLPLPLPLSLTLPLSFPRQQRGESKYPFPKSELVFFFF